MFSSLVRNRSIAFSPDDDGARGAAGAATTDDNPDDAGGGEGGEAGEGKGKGEPKDDRPEWRKRLDAMKETLGGGKTDDAEEVDEDDEEGGERKPGAKGDDKASPAGKGKSGAEGDDKGTGPIMVKVPGRHADDEEVEIPLDRAALKAAGITPKEAADRIAHLKNGFARRAELEAERADVDAGRRELNEIVTEMRDKPVAFFLDNVDAKQYRPLVEALITRMSDADFKVVIERVAEYDADASRRRDAGARAREEQANRRDQRGRQTEQEKKRDEYVKAVTTEINNFVPEDWTDADAEEFFEFATTRLQNHARRNNLKGIAPKDIPELLSTLGVLERFGLTEAPTDRPAKRTTPPSGRNAPPPTRRPASGKPRDTAADLQDRRDRKRDATTTPGGAGAAAAGAPPKGQGFLARLNFVRKTHGIPEKKYDGKK